MVVFNNKGQSIVIFVIMLPIIMLAVAYFYDVSKMNYEKNRLNSIALLAKDSSDTDSCDIVKQNDKDIDCIINDNKITLKKEINSIFGIVIGKEKYKISVTIEK